MWFTALPVDNAPSCGQLGLTSDQGAALAALDEEDVPLDVEVELELPLEDVEDEVLELDEDESEDFELDEDESELVELAAAALLFLLPASERLSVR